MQHQNGNGILEQYTGSLSQHIQTEYSIPPKYYRGDLKLGLRNSDGTGVPIGVTRVGSVLGYMIEDGVRIPVPGQLYYRGIELTEIVEAHRQAGTFGYEEVAYLLLMGYLPSHSELNRFNEIMNRARKLPNGFTEDMIMKNPSRNIMNKLARCVLSLYSYDKHPDDTSLDNILLQSVKLIGAFPSIVANAYSVKRHYFEGGSLHIHFPVEGLSTAENFLRMIRPQHGVHGRGSPPAGHDAHGPRRARRRQQLHLRLPRPFLQRHGYLQRYLRGRRLPERSPPRRRQRQGHGDVPLCEGKRRSQRTTAPSRIT